MKCFIFFIFIKYDLFCSRVRLLNQTDVIAFQHNSAKVLAFSLSFDVVFFCIIEHQVHVFIESNNCSFNSQVDVLEDPDTDSRAVLKVSEDQIDGLDHY